MIQSKLSNFAHMIGQKIILANEEKRLLCVAPSIFAQKSHQFSAHRSESSPNLIGRITGFESDIQKRTAFTSEFKKLGMRWNKDTKSWEPTTSIEFDKINQILKKQELKTETSSAPQPVQQSQYEVRINELLKNWEGKLVSLLPKQVSSERFLESLRLALLNAKRSGEKSSDQALYKACSQCAQTGLTPGPLNEAYFSSRENQIEFLLGYKGIISLAIRAIPGLIVDSKAIFEGDHFNYTLGTQVRIEHSSGEERDSGKITHAYVMITFPDGTTKVTVIDEEHVNKRKSCSKGANSPTSPWNTFPREMWLKTAIRDAFRFVSLSGDAQGTGEINREFLIRLQGVLKAEIDELQAATEEKQEKTLRPKSISEDKIDEHQVATDERREKPL